VALESVAAPRSASRGDLVPPTGLCVVATRCESLSLTDTDLLEQLHRELYGDPS
jgi:hypothetical protein